jgi:nucleoside-diphosphate-sugar epimerase
MKVFVAGATGAIGTQLVPQLAAAGHDVIGMTRSPAKTDALGALGARLVVADALDPDAVARAVAETEPEPEVIVHQLTALKGEPGLREMRNPDRFGAMTNRLRTEGTDHLLAAGRAVGIRRFIAQSVVAIGTYARTGGPVKTEEDPPDLDLPAKGRSGADAVRYLEDAVTGIEGAEGIVLRYGAFYGPGTGLSADPEALLTKAIRKRRFPIIGGGGGVWSLVHIEDAASATVAAVDNGGPGIYNVVDDEPAPVREWLPFLAEQLGARSRCGSPGSWSGCWPARPRCW